MSLPCTEAEAFLEGFGCSAMADADAGRAEDASAAAAGEGAAWMVRCILEGNDCEGLHNSFARVRVTEQPFFSASLTVLWGGISHRVLTFGG